MYLLDKDDNELHKFYVDLGRLSFLGKELRNVSIYQYPIIIFEFMTGYFTTEELYEKNRELGLEFTKEYEIMELPKDIKLMKSSMTIRDNKSLNRDPRENKLLSASTMLPSIKEMPNESQSPTKKKLNPDTKDYEKNSEEFVSKLETVVKNQAEKNNILKSANTIAGSNIINENPVVKSETKENLTKSLDNSSTKKTPYVKKNQKKSNESKTNQTSPLIPYSNYLKDYQMLIYLINPQENLKETNPNFGKELEVFNDGLEKYKRKLRILEMEKEIEFLTKKNEAIKDLSKDLEEAIKHKKENLQKVTNQLKPNQINYTNKLNQLKNNLNGRGQYQLIYDSFVYQKMAEVCFVFFNNKIQSLYKIPDFYNEPISFNDTKKAERLEKYNAEKKKISAMMGHICQLLIYLSKTFNIPLRFPIFLNGSRSYILRSVKDKMFLPLYFDMKKDDKHGNFENALNCLKDDIKEIFNFLSMFPEIISKSDNENINNMNGKYLFFFFFVVFNHSLFRFMKTLQNAV